MSSLFVYSYRGISFELLKFEPTTGFCSVLNYCSRGPVITFGSGLV
jgi:hypothetical protein